MSTVPAGHDSVSQSGLCLIDPRDKPGGNWGECSGSQLIDRLKGITDFSKYEYITLETDAVDNDGAIHFYEKNGFVKERMFETAEGRKMFEFRFKQ